MQTGATRLHLPKQLNPQPQPPILPHHACSQCQLACRPLPQALSGPWTREVQICIIGLQFPEIPKAAAQNSDCSSLLTPIGMPGVLIHAASLSVLRPLLHASRRPFHEMQSFQQSRALFGAFHLQRTNVSAFLSLFCWKRSCVFCFVLFLHRAHSSSLCPSLFHVASCTLLKTIAVRFGYCSFIIIVTALCYSQVWHPSQAVSLVI